MEIRIYYEDTDAGGVVYHSNYINFCERTRSEIFFKNGMSPHNNDEFFVVKHIECDYKKPAVFADVLYVNTKLITKKKASLDIYHEIKRGDELLFTCKVKLAYLKNFKPTKIPEEILEIFKPFE